MSEETAVEMFVGGLMLDRNTQAPVVILKDETGEVCLPIWIGIAEATSIASALKQVSMARPLTHDLMHDIFGEVGVKVQRVVITDLKESTYYAELILSYGEKALIFDARPSDAIAVAIREAAPIYVVQKVLDHAKVAFANAGQALPTDPSAVSEGEEGSEGDPQQTEGGKDFSAIDREKWNEILAELDPDDFKYKV